MVVVSASVPFRLLSARTSFECKCSFSKSQQPGFHNSAEFAEIQQIQVKTEFCNLDSFHRIRQEISKIQPQNPKFWTLTATGCIIMLQVEMDPGGYQSLRFLIHYCLVWFEANHFCASLSPLIVALCLQFEKLQSKFGAILGVQSWLEHAKFSTQE
jgi:hypothetical protein